METEDERDEHTFTSLPWQVNKLVRKLRNQAPKGAPQPEGHGAESREGGSTATEQPNAHAENGREVLKLQIVGVRSR